LLQRLRPWYQATDWWNHRHTSPPLVCFQFVKEPNSWFEERSSRFDSSQSLKSIYRVFILYCFITLVIM
jgi:hypothetical protein